ncbi:MAG: hypothetical protein ABFD92_18240 [Planctomycetaceae bacterium]|nr:hypothetical protein [Planctomycetaceae bacterium]
MIKTHVLAGALLIAGLAGGGEMAGVDHIECLGIWQFEYDVAGSHVKETWVLRANSKYIRFFDGLPGAKTALDEETGTYTVVDKNRIIFIFDSEVCGQMSFQVGKKEGKHYVSRDGNQWWEARRSLVGHLEK